MLINGRSTDLSATGLFALDWRRCRAGRAIVPDFLASEQLLDKIRTILTEDVSLKELRLRNKRRLHEDLEFR